MMISGARVLEVEKTDLYHTRITELPKTSLKTGEVRLSIDNFALTANNITYAVYGDSMGYWKFFPSEEHGWGRIPVWGFATVEESLYDDIDVGERFFGYFPMATELIVQPERNREDGFSDGSNHRQALPSIYNRYTRISSDPSYRADFENQQMLFRPLFMTSFLIDDQLAEFDFYGARQVVLSSASSKTAMALAWLLQERDIDVIALTSQNSRSFVRNSQAYKKTVLYEDIETGLDMASSVFVDFAGSPETARKVHTRLGDDLKASIMVGATNWQAGSTSEDTAPLPGPERSFFFAPDQGDKLVSEIGPEEFSRRVGTKMLEFYEPASRWIKTVRGLGDEAISESYDRVLRGKALPSEGFILSFSV